MVKADGESLSKANGLLALQFLSDFGDQITNALLALCILDITQSTEKVGFIYIVTTLGFVVFTLVGGLLGDIVSRRTILCFADIGRGIAILFLILAVKEKSIILIYATSFLLSLLGSIHGPVKVSTWTENIPARYLERYNSLFEFSLQASTIFGPLVASFFILRNAVNVGFAVDALTFFICALIFSQIVAKKSPTKKHILKRDFLKGISIIVKENEIKKFIYYDALQMVGFGAFNATLLILAQRDFGWTKTDYSFHLTIVAFFTTLGALFGATRFSTKIDPVVKLTFCAIMSSLFLYTALKIQSFPYTSFFIGICDGLIVLTMAVARTKVQLISKELYPEYLSSILAARAIAIKTATLFGTSVCLLMEKFISLEATLMIFTIPVGISFLPIYLYTKRTVSIEKTSTSAALVK